MLLTRGVQELKEFDARALERVFISTRAGLRAYLEWGFKRCCKCAEICRWTVKVPISCSIATRLSAGPRSCRS